MKKKVRVKSLPKAQNGMQPPMVLTPEQKAIWAQNQNMFGTPPSLFADVYKGNPNTTGSFNVGMPEFFQTKKGTPLYFDKPKTSVGEPLFFNKNTTPFNNPFALGDSDFIYNTKRPATSGEFVKSPGIGPIGADDYYANLAQQNIAAPAGTRFDKDFGYAPGTAMPSDLVKPEQQKGNPYIGPMLLAGTDVFSSVARKIQDRSTEEDFRDQFLADNLYNVRPEDYSGNRGDYNFNEFGFGPSFRPDDYVYGMYNKIAQMGGEMKRKVKITNLPQAGYGGTQNAKAVNQLYGNSAYMMNMFNGATKGEPQEEYNQTLGPDPRSISVLEAEKGETLVRKGTNSTIPEFFKIGGKRHSEGGTPLAGDKATPDSFIYSDTKAMKIKDPAILESFGFAAKKGGYTPAKISKKFDLNNKELREGLYSDTDPLRKKTAVMMADNYISNLGKLALVQESQKGFPQGVPEIAMPYMNKVGLDPAQFLPPSPEEGMMMAMYGGIPKAQIGQSVDPTGMSNVPVNKLPQYEMDWLKFRQRALDQNQQLPSTQEYMKAREQYNRAKMENSSIFNPFNWDDYINYGLTGQFENMGDSYSKYNGEGPMTTAIRYGTDPIFMASAAAPVGKVLGTVGKKLGAVGVGSSAIDFLKTASVPNILEASGMALKDIPSNLASIADVTIPIIQKLAAPSALALLILSANNNEQLTPEQEIALLKRLDTTAVNELMESPAASKISSDTLIEASKENPNIDVAKIEPVTIKGKRKEQPVSSQITDAYLDSMINVKRQDILNKKEYGGELEEYQTAGQVTGEKDYVEEITLPNGSKGKRITKGNTISIVDASGKVLKSQSIEPNYRTINPARLSELEKAGIKLTVPKRYEGKEWSMTPGKQGARDGSGTFGTEDWYAGENKDDFARRQARFLRFYPKFNPKNQADNEVFQTWYNSDIYDQSIKAGLSEEEAKKNVLEFGFDPNSKDPNALDKMFGHYTWSRPTINISGKPNTPETPRDPLEPGELNPPPIPKRPIGFYPQDVLNTAAAVGDLASINRYYPRMAQFTAEPMEPTFYDPNRELAANAEMANIAGANLAQFTGPQAFNSRFSEVQGKGLANAANILSRYNNLNVGVANQFEQANKQLINEANFRNQLAANDFYDKTVTTNQNYDNARRAGRREAVDYVNAALENRFMTDQMNSLYPNYFVDPAALKTYYNPGRKITPGQKAKDLKQYFLDMGIDTTNPTVQAAMVRGIMGDVDVDERGNILAAQSAMSNRKKTKGS
jgi:hypothetical protein